MFATCSRAVVPCLQPRLPLAPRPTAQLQKLCVAHFTEYTLSSDDKLDIMELCHKFDMTLNLGQQDRLGAFFVDEAEVITPLATVKGVKPVLEYFEKCRPVAAGKRHLTCNIMVEADGVNAAKVTAYRILHAASNPPALVATGIIEDRLVNVNGEWKFAQRNFIMDPPAAQQQQPAASNSSSSSSSTTS